MFDDSEKIVIAGPITIGDDDPITKYRAESDGRTFWAFNNMEVFYSDDRGYDWLDEIWKLKARIKELERQIQNFTLVGKSVMKALEKHGAYIVPHLMDTDENSGEFLRRLCDGDHEETFVPYGGQDYARKL